MVVGDGSVYSCAHIFLFSTGGKGEKYSSPLDAMVKCVRSEGLRGLYKGFTPTWVRLGPHTMITLFVFEQLRKLYGIRPV